MRKKYVLLVLIIVISITLIVSFNNKTINKLDEVKLNEKESEMFAIMLEQENQTYLESDSNEWPDYKYKFNKELSGCIDKNGDKIKEEILTFDEKERKATVETSKTSYCYLYFDKKITAPGTKLEGYSNLSYDLKGGMYRYQGDTDTIDNNYICFGTTDKQDCIDNQDIYMYRIIGIVGEECTNKNTQICDDTVSKDMIKVIKTTSLKSGSENTFSWYTSNNDDITWKDSNLKKRLNGEGEGNKLNNTNIFLGNAASYNNLYPYLNPNDTTWTDKIVNKQWYQGDIHYSYAPTTAEEMFKQEYGITPAHNIEGTEITWTLIDNFKVGLMSLSDYYWSCSIDGNNCYGNFDMECMKSWMKGGTDITKGREFTMSRIGYVNGTVGNYSMWLLQSNGLLFSSGLLSGSFSVRPVFYLNSNINLSGTGISSDPFIIQ